MKRGRGSNKGSAGAASRAKRAPAASSAGVEDEALQSLRILAEQFVDAKCPLQVFLFCILIRRENIKDLYIKNRNYILGLQQFELNKGLKHPQKQAIKCLNAALPPTPLHAPLPQTEAEVRVCCRLTPSPAQNNLLGTDMLAAGHAAAGAHAQCGPGQSQTGARGA